MFVAGTATRLSDPPADAADARSSTCCATLWASPTASSSARSVDAAYREKKIGEVEKGRHAAVSMIEDLAKIPLEFSPGEAWNYSVSTDVLGYLVGKIGGKPFEQFLKERIFEPLGMNDTDFFVPPTRLHRFAACCSADPQGGFNLLAAEGAAPDAAGRSGRRVRSCRRPRWSPAAADRCSTAGDYLTFCRAAAQRRRTRRYPPARPKDAEADGLPTIPQRRRPAGDIALDVRRGRL